MYLDTFSRLFQNQMTPIRQIVFREGALLSVFQAPRVFLRSSVIKSRLFSAISYQKIGQMWDDTNWSPIISHETCVPDQ